MYNSSVALESNDQALNIGLRHIQTLQEINSIGSNTLFWTNEQYPLEVTLTIDTEEDKVNVEFVENEYPTISIDLSDYKYLIDSFSVS